MEKEFDYMQLRSKIKDFALEKKIPCPSKKKKGDVS